MPTELTLFDVLIRLGLGLVGGVAAEGLQYLYVRRRPQRFSVQRAAGITIVAALAAALYFTLVDTGIRFWPLFIHYGVFVTLIIEEYFEGRATTSRHMRAGGFSMIPVAQGTPLVLNGFWPVYGVGAFGGFLAELYELYVERKKQVALPLRYWIISGLMVLSAGVVAVLYGIENVSGILALQIGASTPLIAKRVRGAG